MITQNLGKILKENAYPGRGLVIGKSDDGNPYTQSKCEKNKASGLRSLCYN